MNSGWIHCDKCGKDKYGDTATSVCDECAPQAAPQAAPTTFRKGFAFPEWPIAWPVHEVTLHKVYTAALRYSDEAVAAALDVEAVEDLVSEALDKGYGPFPNVTYKFSTDYDAEHAQMVIKLEVYQ